MIESSDDFWWVQLDDESSARADKPSFHAFAEGQHSDLRGQVFHLKAGEQLELPHDRWPEHLFVVTGISGGAQIDIAQRTLALRPLSQLVVLPGVACRLTAQSEVAFELMSLRSHRAHG